MKESISTSACLYRFVWMGGGEGGGRGNEGWYI